MGLFRGVLLGTGAALVSVAAAQAADLPSRKAAPVEYVRVCDAYGAGFFFIPGTQTCLRIGGRVRADYAFSPGQTTRSGGAASTGTISSTTLSLADAQHTVGWEARGRINVDARTQTAWGTVQTAFQLRMSRADGVINVSDGAEGRGHNTGSTLESAFIRFAGFTFGAARDNFAFMPSLTYGAGHWASFGNGAKQLAYTHTFGGGLSATVALQEHQDTTLGGVSTNSTAAEGGGAYYVHNSLPQINGRIDWQQSWGELSVAGAVANVSANNVTDTYDRSETVWAVSGGLKLNLPMLASGSALWLTGAYADGMTEYTTNWTSFKNTAFLRDAGGYAMNHPSYVYGPNGIETVKSWNVAALLQHFWAPQWRSVAWASYGQVGGTTTSQSAAWNGVNRFGDATVWNIGKQLAWLPTRDFEIGVEVIYSRVSQDVAGGGAGIAAPSGTTIYRDSQGNFTGRLRVERNF